MLSGERSCALNAATDGFGWLSASGSGRAVGGVSGVWTSSGRRRSGCCRRVRSGVGRIGPWDGGEVKPVTSAVTALRQNSPGRAGVGCPVALSRRSPRTAHRTETPHRPRSGPRAVPALQRLEPQLKRSERLGGRIPEQGPHRSGGAVWPRPSTTPGALARTCGTPARPRPRPPQDHCWRSTREPRVPDTPWSVRRGRQPGRPWSRTACTPHARAASCGEVS